MKLLLDREGLSFFLNYDIYANRIILENVAALSAEEYTRKCIPSHGTMHDLLAHMFVGDQYFLDACRGKPFAPPQEDAPSFAGLRAYYEQIAQETLDFVQSLEEADLTREVTVDFGKHQLHYPLWQVLVQSWMHTNHHRGEVCMALTGLGKPYPRDTDMIILLTQLNGQTWPF